MKRTLFATSAAAVAGLAAADSYYTGDGTAYTLGSVSSGNCNFMYDPGVGSNYAALNAAQWDDTLNCGRCAEVSCADDACSDTTSTVTVYLVDQCPECKEGDLDLSPTVFKTLTGSDPARYSIKWRFVDCPVSGNLQYCAKSGSSSYWLAVQPANMLTGVASMTIGGKTPSMVDSAYYFLLDSGGVDMSAVEIATTSVSGETVTETVSLTADSCTAGSKQFSGGSSSSSSTTTSSSNETPKLTTPTPTTAAPATTSAPATTAPATTAPVATTATPSKQSSDSSAGTTTTGESTEDTQVANDFDTLNDGSSNETAVVGTVSAPEGESSSSGVSILDSSETGVANTPTSTSSTSTDDSGTEEANTKSADSSSATSPVLIALAVAAAVGAVALAAVYVRVQKKKIDDKVNDRDDNAMQRSFDTFNSPVRVTSAIAQI